MDDVEGRVAIGEPVERSFDDDDGDAPASDMVRLYFCSTCDSRAFIREDDAWEHSLLRHSIVALPSSDAIVALDFPASADA